MLSPTAVMAKAIDMEVTTLNVLVSILIIIEDSKNYLRIQYIKCTLNYKVSEGNYI
jgi:hypothetical protein